MSWIITYPPEYYLKLGGESGPQTRFAPNFNGVSQKGLLSSNVTLNAGDTIKFKASKPTVDFATVVDAVSRSFRLRYRGDGTIQSVGFLGTVNGQPITSLSTVWPDGISEFVLTLYADGEINSIGSRSDADSAFFDGFIFDFSINDGSVHNYIMNDGDGIMRNTGSGADGAYPNWTVAMWQQVSA